METPTPTIKPNISQVQTLNFAEALDQTFLYGQRCTRLSWETNEIYIYVDNDELRLMKNGTPFTLVVSRGDVEGMDWHVLPQ